MQEKLFYDDEYEALSLMISCSERPFKEVAQFLFPHLKADSSYARLKSCLNPDKDERLTFGQILAAMKFCGRYDPLLFACDETMHARPERKTPEDAKARIVEVIQSAAATLDRATRQLASLQATEVSTPRRVA